MQRRQWLTYCAGALVATTAGSAQADDDFVEFSQDRYEEALASGKPFMVGFLSSW